MTKEKKDRGMVVKHSSGGSKRPETYEERQARQTREALASPAFKPEPVVPKVLELFDVQVNNHGCKGQSVKVCLIGERSGAVEEVQDAADCCGRYAHLGLEVGDIVKLPDWWVGSFDEAADLDERFQRTDISWSGQTNVLPRDLKVPSRS